MNKSFQGIIKIWLAGIIIVLSSGSGRMAFSQQASAGMLNRFSLEGSRNIMDEDDFGIINGRMTFRVNYRDVSTVSGLYAPPYASSDYLMEIRFFGEKVPTRERYQWYPNEVRRYGTIQGIDISTVTVLTAKERAGLIAVTLTNTTGKDQIIPVGISIKGGLDYVLSWGFFRPEARRPVRTEVSENTLVRSNSAGSIVVSTDIPGLKWFELAAHWNTCVNLPAGSSTTYHVAIGIGGADEPLPACRQILQDPRQTISDARDACASRLEDIFTKLPKFTADNKELEAFYYRSLINLYMTRWEVPEFILHPYYGSGAVIGGCVGNYLWEFGIPAEIFPLYDAPAAKEHIKQFMRIDITKHYLFNPMNGQADGPWYPVNQSLIIRLIYYYVLHTGDVRFLEEKINGTAVLDYAITCALFGDDTSKPVSLYDYGKEGEHHLELRRGFPYQGVMPDLNGRRYDSYLKTFQLTKLAGRPADYLPERAMALKALLKKQLWNAENQWFYFKADGKKQTRWTGLMFMLINSGVLDREEEKGLLTHWNDKEFLGEYGLHSIAKTDPAYDQVDIDNGGGGSYNAFPPMICERLYNSGYPTAADNLLQRILWWGERVPYWGDSFVANFIGYREDTPLQSDFSSLAGAQSVIFGMFGVSVNFAGDITINPHVPSFSPAIALQGLKLRGYNIDITADQRGYMVKANGKTYQSEIGNPLLIPAAGKK